MGNKINFIAADTLMDNTGDSFYSTMLEATNESTTESCVNPFFQVPDLINERKNARVLLTLKKQLAPLRVKEVQAQMNEKILQAEIKKLVFKLRNQKALCSKLVDKRRTLELEIRKKEYLYRS